MRNGFAASRHIGSDNFGSGLVGNLPDHVPPLKHLSIGNPISRNRLYDSQVDLFDLPPFELSGKLPGGTWGCGKQQHAGNRPIKPVRYTEKTTRVTAAASGKIYCDCLPKQLAANEPLD